MFINIKEATMTNSELLKQINTIRASITREYMQLPEAEKANAMSLYKQLEDLGQSLYRYEILSKNGLTNEANAEIGKINELASLMNLCYNPIKRTEQAQRDIMILTKSSKHHDYCVAGIDCVTGKFVRLMSHNDDKEGALSEEHMHYDNDADAQILDIARVKTVKNTPTKIQPENVLIDENDKWEKIATVPLQEAFKYLNNDVEYIFCNNKPHLTKEEAESCNCSLIFVQVQNACVYTIDDIRDRKKTKMSFVFNGEEYKDIAVTDPDYRDKNEKLVRANIVFSLPDGDWSEEHGKYCKFAAKIFKVA